MERGESGYGLGVPTKNEIQTSFTIGATKEISTNFSYQLSENSNLELKLIIACKQRISKWAFLPA